MEVRDGWEKKAKKEPSETESKAQLIDATLLTTTNGKVTAKSVLAGKIVALFFSSEWCPDCKSFVGPLKDAYEKANSTGKRFEIVFVSSDNDAASQQAYVASKHGDWLQIAYDDPLRNELKMRWVGLQ